MKLVEEFRHRVDDVSTDGFALLVSLPHVPLGIPSATEAGTGRLRRFTLRVPLTYRLGTDLRWRRGVTDNVSHGGLLFHTRSTEGLRGTEIGNRRIPVEVLLKPPADTGTDLPPIRCEGRILRVAGDEGSVALRVAATVRGFRLLDHLPRATVTEPVPVATHGHQRRSPRSPLGYSDRVLAELSAEQGDGASSSGHVVSLGHGGAFIEVAGSYPEGSRVIVRLKLPPAFDEIICWATVRDGRNGRGIGIEFHDLVERDAERIRSFVARHLATRLS